jgi:hypothetical protein
MAIEYGSSPVEHGMLNRRSTRNAIGTESTVPYEAGQRCEGLAIAEEPRLGNTADPMSSWRSSREAHRSSQYVSRLVAPQAAARSMFATAD